MNRKECAAVGALIATSVAGNVFAADSAGTGLEEVMVTSSRIERPLSTYYSQTSPIDVRYFKGIGRTFRVLYQVGF